MSAESATYPISSHRSHKISGVVTPRNRIPWFLDLDTVHCSAMTVHGATGTIKGTMVSLHMASCQYPKSTDSTKWNFLESWHPLVRLSHTRALEAFVTRQIKLISQSLPTNCP